MPSWSWCSNSQFVCATRARRLAQSGRLQLMKHTEIFNRKSCHWTARKQTKRQVRTSSCQRSASERAPGGQPRCDIIPSAVFRISLQFGGCRSDQTHCQPFQQLCGLRTMHSAMQRFCLCKVAERCTKSGGVLQQRCGGLSQTIDLYRRCHNRWSQRAARCSATDPRNL